MSITIKIRSTEETVTLRGNYNVNSTTVKAIKEDYCNQHNNAFTPDKLTFRKAGKELKPDDATLAFCKIKGKYVLITMSSRCGGGAQYVPNINVLNNNRNRKLNTSDPEIKLSNKACCVYFDKNGNTAAMPCGHAFSPLGMFGTLKSLMVKNKYEWEIKCPKCNTVFDFDLCAKVADLSDDEYLYFLEEIEKRSSPETKPCPDCGIDCERPVTLKKFRVNCNACTGGDWCFICAQKWKASGFTVCGNKNCELYDINDILKQVPMKKASNNVEIPELRCCPKCLWFIEHKEACKHMKCEKCGHDFCFACLKPKLNTGWQCGSYGQQCVVADRQQF